jgi:uncharacterized FlaG/YvyC family protein
MQGQPLALAEAARDRYWEQRAQEMPAVAASGEAEGADRRQGQAKSQRPAIRRTYTEFEIDRDNHEVIVRIINAETGELIRTVPPDELAKELANGSLCLNRPRRVAFQL